MTRSSIANPLRALSRVLFASGGLTFATSVGRLSGGTALGALAGLIAAPLLTRVYSPSEFGVLGVYASLLALVSVVGSLRYDLAVPTPRDDREAGRVLIVALFSTTVVSGLCAVSVSVAISGRLPGLAASSDLDWLWWLPVGMLASSGYTVLSSWMVRRRDFATLGSTKFTQGLSQSILQVGLGLAGWGSTGLILGQIFGSSGGIVRLWLRFWKLDGQVLAGVTPRQVARSAGDYRRFALLSSPAALLDALAAAIPLLYVASRFGVGPAGLLTLVQRTLYAPLTLLTVSIGQVVFGDLAEHRRHQPERLGTMFRWRLRQVSLLGICLFVPLLVAMPEVLARVFGDRWTNASGIFLRLAPMMYLNFVSAPFGYAVDVLRRQDIQLLRDIVRVTVMGLALLISSNAHATLTATMWLISGAGVVNGLVYLAASWRAISAHTKAGSVDFAAAALADSQSS